MACPPPVVPGGEAAKNSSEPVSRIHSAVNEFHLDRHSYLIATGGDPFELGSARPLDFGHWAAHKLEQLSNFQIRHGEAVAIGIALDVLYSRNISLLHAASAERILALLQKLELPLSACDGTRRTYPEGSPYVEKVADAFDKLDLQKLDAEVKAHPDKFPEAMSELTESLMGEHTYYYWLENACAPDFARTVDIHRKPGFDPVELFLDPKIPLPKLKIAWRLLQKKLGFRMLMDVIPLDATLVKGSHGRRPSHKKDWPLFITSHPENLGAKQIESTDVFQMLLRYLK